MAIILLKVISFMGARFLINDARRPHLLCAADGWHEPDTAREWLLFLLRDTGLHGQKTAVLMA